MKIETMVKSAYEQAYGPVRSRGVNAETAVLWEKVKKLPIVEYLIVELDKGDKLQPVKQGLYAKLRKMADVTHANFKVKLAANREENHVVIWKEAKQP